MSDERGTRIALGLVLVLAVLFAVRQIDSLDTGFHLAAGRWIVEELRWPRTDPLTYTLQDRPYVDTSWGYQVLAERAAALGGSRLLVSAHAGLVLATFGLLAATARLRAGGRRWLVPLLLLAALVAEPRFRARPELLSYLLLAATLWVLHRYRERNDARVLRLLPPLFLLWANCHSLFLVGWGALAAFVVGDGIAERRLDRRLALWAAGALFASLINPYGWGAPAFALSLATRFDAANPFAASIAEFMSPLEFVRGPLAHLHPWSSAGYFLLLAGWAAAAVVQFRRRRFGWLGFSAAAAVLSLGMIRNVPLFVVAALPGIVWSAERWRALPRAAVVTCGGIALLLALRVVSGAWYVDHWREERFGWSWNPIVLPVDAARWLAERPGWEGRPLNHLNFGGYLGWALDRPMFIDGRLEVVGEEFYAEYLDAVGSASGFDRAVARWGIEWVVFPHKTSGGLLQFLAAEPGWRLAYGDHVAVIFGRGAGPREGPAFREAAALRLDDLPGLGRTPPVSRWERLLGGFVRRRYPSRAFGEGVLLQRLGEPLRAARAYARAIEQCRGAEPELLHNLGLALAQAGRTQEARRAFDALLARRPGHRGAREARAALPGAP